MVNKSLFLMGLLMVIVGVRWWMWKRPAEPGYKAGDEVKIQETVKSIKTKWGKDYLVVDDIWVEVPNTYVLNLGERVEIAGKLKERLIAGQPDGFWLQISHIRVIRASNRNKGVAGLRTKMQDLMLSWWPGERGALASGILLGGTEGMSFENRDKFRRLGLSHMVAASGYNVALVSGWVMGVGIKAGGRKKAIYFVTISIVLYMFLAGMSASVVRAGVMAIISTIGLLLGRITSAWWVLLITILVMLGINPGYLEDVGFQLSVAATVGLLAAGGGEENKNWIKGWWSDIKTTLVASVITLPLILHHFGQLSVAAPLANAAFLIMVPVIMQVMAAAVVVGLIVPGWGEMVSWLAWPSLEIVVRGTEWMNGWSWVSWETGNLSWSWVVLYYGVLAGGYYLVMAKVPKD